MEKIKKIMQSKRTRYVATGIMASMLISAGMVLALYNFYKEQEIESIRDLTEKTVLMKANSEYELLEQVNSEWETFEKNHGYASFYNKGWANLTTFIETGEVTAYLAAKNSFKESIRKDPTSFNAKYNLSITEATAKKYGIEPFEIPDDLNPNNSQESTPGADKKPSGSSSGQEDQSDEKKMKDKLLSGDAPTYTADPPDLDLVPGEEESTSPLIGRGY